MTTSFDGRSTTEDVLAGIDLSGTSVLVTGVSSGLGLETARAAATHGADRGRDRPATSTRRAAALEPHDDLDIEVVACELASLASVRAAADALVSRGEAFDVVIANAGVMNCPFGQTADGFETHFGTNHLGHFVLVNRIAPLIRDGGRVISLTSLAHHAADIDLDDPGFETESYSPFLAYGRSKTATVLFAVELDRRLRSKGVRGIAVQPGGIRTRAAAAHHTGSDAGDAATGSLTAADERVPRRPASGEDRRARRRHHGLGRLRRRCRGGGWPLLRGLPRRRGHRVR